MSVRAAKALALAILCIYKDSLEPSLLNSVISIKLLCASSYKDDEYMTLITSNLKWCMHLDSTQLVASSIPARSHTFVEIDHEIISEIVLILFPSVESF